MADSTQVMSLDAAAVDSMKVSSLKKELKARHLTSSGTKSELAERLKEAIIQENQELPLDDTLGLEDEGALLAQEEEELLKADDVEDALDDSHIPANLPEESFEDNGAVLDSTTDNGTAVVSTTENEPTVAVISDKPLTAEERLLKRQQKFGVQSEAAKKLLRQQKYGANSEDAKKTARAQRFNLSSGDSSSPTKTANSSKFEPPPVDAEKLKKRADRFGTTTTAVSSEAGKVVASDKMLKRMARFGSASSGAVDLDSQEKKKKRMERFGQ